MFTLKLYRNGPLPPEGKTVIIETAGLWVDHIPGDVKRIQAFKKKVGTQDEDGTQEFYVGGTWSAQPPGSSEPPPAVTADNYFTWGVLENAQGKTTEVFR